MKNILFILVISQFFIYNRNGKENIIIEKGNPFVGKWNFIIINGNNCFVYPKIEFEKSGTGSLLISGTKIDFTYVSLPNNKIRIDFLKDNQNYSEQSEVFYYENRIDKDFEQIDLFKIEDRYNIYSLVREIPNKKE